MATRHTPEIEEILPAYALGALEGEELAMLEQHLATGCPECRRQLAGWQGDLEALADSVPPVAPAETTRARLLRAIAADAAEGRGSAVKPGPPVWSWLRLAAAAVLIVALAWTGWSAATARREAGRIAAERDRLASRAAALTTELAAARNEAMRLTRALEVLGAPGMQPVALAGLGSLPEAVGRTFVDPAAGRAVFVAANLPPAPAGKTYQLWFIAGGRPVSAGVFGVDAHGHAALQVEEVAPPGQIQAWAVTVEPEGGVPQPTGEMVLKG